MYKIKEADLKGVKLTAGKDATIVVKSSWCSQTAPNINAKHPIVSFPTLFDYNREQRSSTRLDITSSTCFEIQVFSSNIHVYEKDLSF